MASSGWVVGESLAALGVSFAYVLSHMRGLHSYHSNLSPNLHSNIAPLAPMSSIYSILSFNLLHFSRWVFGMASVSGSCGTVVYNINSNFFKNIFDLNNK